MSIVLFSSLAGIALVFWFYNNNSKIIYLKRGLLPLFSILFIIALILFSKTAISAASRGIKLWLEVVFPSLFPFFVASQLLSRSGFINVFGVVLEPIMRPLFNIPGSGSFALAMGIVSGYPVGAKITTDLKGENLITKVEAERLLTFTNNSGPLFIMGAVAVGMFNLPRAGYLLYACHVAACLTVGILFRFYKKDKKNNTPVSNQSALSRLRVELHKIRNSKINPWTLFGECIKDSVFTILAIGGFIVFFSVFINLLINSGLTSWICSLAPQSFEAIGLGPKGIEALFCGIFEITTGTSLINSAANIDLGIKLCIASLIIGWAGISVHAQVISIVSKEDISIKPYILGKALQGVIASIYTFIGYKIFQESLLQYSTAFAHTSSKYVDNWVNVIKFSSQNALICISAILVLSISVLCIKRLFHMKKVS